MAKREKFRIPDLRNVTMPFICDELGDIRAQIKGLQKYEGILKERAKSLKEDDVEEYEGDVFEMVFNQVCQVRLDNDLIRMDMDEEWLTAHSKEVEYVMIKVNKL